MPELGKLVEKVRSKNAGPFWLTVDVFCGDRTAYETVSGALTTARIAQVFAVEPDQIKRFDIPDLNVVKFSLPRPAIQGTRTDRDMHGAAAAALVAEMQI